MADTNKETMLISKNREGGYQIPQFTKRVKMMGVWISQDVKHNTSVK